MFSSLNNQRVPLTEAVLPSSILCSCHRVDGRIEGLYYDPSSAPDQKLELDALTADAGHAFGHYDMA